MHIEDILRIYDTPEKFRAYWEQWGPVVEKMTNSHIVYELWGTCIECKNPNNWEKADYSLTITMVPKRLE